MTDLREQVKSAIQSFISSQDGYQVPIDILRIFREEANLQLETNYVRDMISSDPFENLKQIKSKALQKLIHELQVTDCERIRTGLHIARTHAVICFPGFNNLTLSFLYLRKPRPGTENGTQISYCIELSHNHGEPQRLLDIQVWASDCVPSAKPAVCIESAFEEVDGWEDIDDDMEDGNVEMTSPPTKKQKAEDDEDCKSSEPQDQEEADKYVVFLDADVLLSLVEAAGIAPIDDGTAFFLLMTFPFYEHEWDLVGFVLDSYFGADSDDDE
eukprot:Nitzschia sp. Nitz4//scaffold3_size479765//14633//15445//NITZ4_000010-RA/size479765-processed-gene-0.79-mRNA-1//-1//CDS//3329550488//3999//frame0